MNKLAIGALVLSCLMWGTTGTVAAFMSADVSPLAVGAFTMGVGGLLLGMITWRHVRATWMIQGARRWILVGGLGVLVYPLAFYVGMDLVGVAVGNAIALGSGPLFAAGLEWSITKAKPSGRWFLALSLAVVGLGLISVARDDAGIDHIGGIGVALLAGLAYATYTVAGGRLIAAGTTSRGSMGAVFSAGALPLLVVLVPLIQPILSSMDNLARAGYLALGPTVVGYLLFGYALIKLPARDVTVITLLEPVATVVIAVAVLHETLPVWGWLGVATLIGGVAVVSIGYSATPRQTPTEQ